MVGLNFLLHTSTNSIIGICINGSLLLLNHGLFFFSLNEIDTEIHSPYKCTVPSKDFKYKENC